jgi:hypothetical protein
MKTFVSALFAAALLVASPVVADDLVTIPDLVGMKNGNDVIAILTAAGLKPEFGDQILPSTPEQALTIAKQFPEAGKKVPRGSLVIVIGYTRYAPSVVGLPLDRAVARLEAAGLRVGSVLLSDPAPTPELADTVVYQLPPDENNAVSLKVYAPYYAPGSGTDGSGGGGGGGGAGGGGGGGGGGGVISAGCGGGRGFVFTTGVNTPCSMDLAALLGVPPSILSDMRLESQPSNGSVTWGNGVLAYTPAKDFRGEDSFIMSSTKKELVDGQIVDAGREKTVWKFIVQ